MFALSLALLMFSRTVFINFVITPINPTVITTTIASCNNSIPDSSVRNLNPTDLKILMTKFDSSETGEASYASTAKKLGLPVSKVKRSITRSLRILRNDDGLKDWFEYQNNDYNSVDGDLVGLGLSDEQLNDYEEMDNDIMVSIGISPEEPTSKARTPKKRISFSVTIDGDFSDSIILKVQGNGQIKKEYV